MTDRKYWLGFSLVPGIGPKRLALLRRAFGDLRHAWEADENQLRGAGLDKTPLANLVRARAQLNLDAELDKVLRAGVTLLTLADDDYPALLKTLDDPPTVLYVRGALLPADSLALAIVGTRKATTYGRDAAHYLARELVQHGVTIISGLAHGIDAAAHRGALDGGGRTLAVLGNGIDIVYPPDHRELAREIAGRGALVTEFPLGVPPEGRNFPQRNRILSGLSRGVLVVEAPEHSGALITAGIAAEQGRDVFAVPGNIFNSASGGTNRLIQDGAKLVMRVDDILNEFNVAVGAAQTQAVAQRIAPDNPLEAQLLAQLDANPVHIDDLARSCGLPVALVSSTLTILELKGHVQMNGPMQYSLTRTS